jgi:hydroxyacylglutathione hydrolase
MSRTLSPEIAWNLTQSGGIIVDLREPGDYAAGHVLGSLSLVFSEKSLAERFEAVADAGTGVVLVAPLGDGQYEIAEAQLIAKEIAVHGVLEGDVGAWQAAGLPIESLPEITLRDLASYTTSPDSVVLDVREPIEWETMGYVPESLLISLGDLRANLDQIPRAARLAVICEAGIRSCTAASVLLSEGFEQVGNVPEGSSGYRREGLPLRYLEP